MSRRASAAALVLALVACEGKRADAPAAPPDGGSTRAEDAASAAAPSSAATARGLGRAGGVDASAVPAAWAFGCEDESAPRSGKSIGHTSVVFKVELSNGKKAAWKPNARNVRGRYRGEAAAYRLAQALGLPNVPPACVRAFDATAASAALAATPEAAKLFASEAIVEDGKVYGVIIPWIDGLTFWPLEKEPLRSEVRAWLGGGEIPAAKVDLARQASSLVAFDFVTGNWDRYSGENVGLDRAGSLVLYIDNDAAFMAGPPKARLAENQARLEATTRFSRRFVARARALDEARLAEALGDEAPGRPLLAAPALTAVAKRISAFVAIVDAKIAAHGADATLYFP